MRKAARGLTVVETMVAVTLFLVTVVALIGLYPATVRATRQAHEHLVATTLAEKELELIRGQQYSEVEGFEQQYDLVLESNGAATPVEFKTKTEKSEVRPGLTRILVSVEWNGIAQKAGKLQMETYVANLSF